MTSPRSAKVVLRLASDRTKNPLADSGPDSMTRQAGVAGAGPGVRQERQQGARGQAPEMLSLRIMATTDVHANILSYDYAGNRPYFGQGLAQTASLIAAARAEVPEAFLFDNGDFLQGSALADLAAHDRRKRVHPVIAAFNALSYDAATLGNHEFNFGIGVLERALQHARFPVVSANVLRERGPGPLQDGTFVPPYTLIERALPDGTGRMRPFRLGVLGLTPPEILRWDREHLEGRLDVRPMLEAARAWVPEMRRAGADLVLCLAHTGIAESSGGLDSEGLATEIAAIPGVDVLVAGHSHLVFPHRAAALDPRINPVEGRLAGTPAVQPGHAGSHLGVIDLVVRRDGVGWVVARAQVRAISVSEEVAGLSSGLIRRNAALLRHAVGNDHRAALAWTRKPIGSTGRAMSTCFAQVSDVGAMCLIAAAKIDYARRALAGTPFVGLPVIATATPYRSGGRGGPLNYTDIAAGALSVRHLFDLYPFPNTAVAIRITGAVLVEHIERSAAAYSQIVPGLQDQPLIDPAFPGHAFTTVHGLSYRIDLTRPARYDTRGQLIRPLSRRVTDLRIGGRPFGAADCFVLVTNNYRIGGSLGISPPRPEDILLEERILLTDVLRGFIQRTGRIDGQLCSDGEGWALQPLPGTTLTYDTGANAEAHLAEAAHLRPALIGLTDEGFHRFRLHL